MNGKNWKKRHGADREWDFGSTASMRLLLRRGMLEMYLDDHFMECYTFRHTGSKSAWSYDSYSEAKNITIGVHGKADTMAIQNMKAWQMTLPGWDK